jgi:hypothetical protein
MITHEVLHIRRILHFTASRKLHKQFSEKMSIIEKHLVLQKYQLYIHHICSRGSGNNETLYCIEKSIGVIAREVIPRICDQVPLTWIGFNDLIVNLNIPWLYGSDNIDRVFHMPLLLRHNNGIIERPLYG